MLDIVSQLSDRPSQGFTAWDHGRALHPPRCDLSIPRQRYHNLNHAFLGSMSLLGYSAIVEIIISAQTRRFLHILALWAHRPCGSATARRSQFHHNLDLLGTSNNKSSRVDFSRNLSLIATQFGMDILLQLLNNFI